MTVTVSRDLAVRASTVATTAIEPTTSENVVITHTRHPITISTNVMAVLAGISASGAVAAEWTGHDDLRSWLIVLALLFIGLALCGLSDDFARRKRADKALSKINPI